MSISQFFFRLPVLTAIVPTLVRAALLNALGFLANAKASRVVIQVLVIGSLIIYACTLGHGAVVHSPTVDEVAHMPAAISHWQQGRFDLYRVNPPFVRMVATLPVLALEPRTNLAAYSEDPFSRPENLFHNRGMCVK